MRAAEIKQVLANARLNPGGDASRLWQIRDLRAAGLDYQTARFIAENPDFIEFICGDRQAECAR